MSGAVLQEQVIHCPCSGSGCPVVGVGHRARHSGALVVTVGGCVRDRCPHGGFPSLVRVQDPFVRCHPHQSPIASTTFSGLRRQLQPAVTNAVMRRTITTGSTPTWLKPHQPVACGLHGRQSRDRRRRPQQCQHPPVPALPGRTRRRPAMAMDPAPLGADTPRRPRRLYRPGRRGRPFRDVYLATLSPHLDPYHTSAQTLLARGTTPSAFIKKRPPRTIRPIERQRPTVDNGIFKNAGRFHR